MILLFGTYIALIRILVLYRIAGFFRGSRLSRISRFCGHSRKFSPRKSIFKQLDTALVDVVHWVIYKQFAKVFSRKRNPLYYYYYYYYGIYRTVCIYKKTKTDINRSTTTKLITPTEGETVRTTKYLVYNYK